MVIEARPLRPTFGAEVVGMDLNKDLDHDTFADIYRAFLDYQVLVFRRQNLNPDAHVAIARRFGEVQVHVLNQYHADSHPELFSLSNLDENGQPNGRHPDLGTLEWHTDSSWQRMTGQATMIYAIEVPVTGGETEICDMYGAYHELDKATRAYYEQLRVIHNLDYSRSRYAAHAPLNATQRDAAPPVDHPLVRTHPETGRRCLYIGDHAETIVGMDYLAGRNLVDRINRDAISPARVYGHDWQPGDVMIWDNRCVMHRARPFDTANDRRVVRRCTVIGDAPY